MPRRNTCISLVKHGNKSKGAVFAALCVCSYLSDSVPIDLGVYPFHAFQHRTLRISYPPATQVGPPARIMARGGRTRSRIYSRNMEDFSDCTKSLVSSAVLAASSGCSAATSGSGVSWGASSDPPDAFAFFPFLTTGPSQN